MELIAILFLFKSLINFSPIVQIRVFVIFLPSVTCTNDLKKVALVFLVFTPLRHQFEKHIHAYELYGPWRGYPWGALEGGVRNVTHSLKVVACLNSTAKLCIACVKGHGTNILAR